MYTDAEIPQAMERLAEWPGVRSVSRWAYPDEDENFLARRLREIKTVEEFQSRVMGPIAHIILDRTSQGLTCSGLEYITGEPTLFVSNHRDIVLDAYFLQTLFNDRHWTTTQVVSGNNLLVNQAIVDIAASNKLIHIGRGGTKRSWGEELLAMSQTLRTALESGASIWIAQRNGRTKDNVDKTDPAIIHMLATSGPIEGYRIVPLTITYEIEPNAVYKAKYLWTKDYPQEPEKEDYMGQIMESILQDKGHIHYAFHEPVDMTMGEGMTHKDYYHVVAERIDAAITAGYAKWPLTEEVRSQWGKMMEGAPDYLRPYLEKFAPGN